MSTSLHHLVYLVCTTSHEYYIVIVGLSPQASPHHSPHLLSHHHSFGLSLQTYNSYKSFPLCTAITDRGLGPDEVRTGVCLFLVSSFTLFCLVTCARLS